MLRRALLVVLAAASTPPLYAECTAESAPDRPHLVELYTSEGCSSCPPAEKWMSSIRDDAHQVGLEFHVDYWDELGWPDPFADARYTARQRTLAERGASSIVYTPQLVVDGRVWKNWPATPAPIARATPAPSLSIGVTQGNGLRVHVGSESADAKRHRLYVALTENDLSSTVSAGENKGRKLEHDGVVRDFAGPLEPPRAQVALDPPPGFDAAKSSVVAFIEDEASGDIVQVVKLPLARCAP